MFHSEFKGLSVTDRGRSEESKTLVSLKVQTRELSLHIALCLYGIIYSFILC